MRAGEYEFIWKIVLFSVLILAPCVKAESFSREEAVALARSGKLNEAVQQLEILRKQHPNDNKIVDDLIVIYCWNGQLKEACVLFEQRNINTYPRYVQIAVQKAYRDLHQPDQALEIVTLLLEQQQDDIDLLLVKGLLLVDKQEFEIVKKNLDIIEKTAGKDSRYYRLSAYLHSAQQQWLPALSDYQHLSTLLPDDPEPSVEQFFILRNILAGTAADNILTETSKQQITKKDRAEFLTNESTVRLRWSTHAADNSKEKRKFALEGIALQIKSLEMLNADNVISKEWPVSMVQDIVVALRNLEQWEDSELIYHYLTKKEDVPEYVRLAAADVMLSNHHPEKSRKLYQLILQQNQKSYEALVGLFYSLVENEDFDEAIQLIETAISREPAFRLPKNSKIHPYNDRYLDMNVYKVMARLYADQLEKAWLQADELARNAPASTWLHEVRGDVAKNRGWPRQALQDYNYAALLEPNDVDILGRRISALIELGEYKKARPLLYKLVEKYPYEEKAIEKAKNEWLLSQKSECWADISWSRTLGTKFDSESLTATSEMLSFPLNDYFFIEGFYRFYWEKFSEEGEETFSSYSSGISYRSAEWNFTGQISYNDSSMKKFGGSMKAVWSLDDFWMLSLTGERFSKNTPLRALHQGISADTLAGEMTYRWSELRSLSAGVEKKSLTDGNSGIAGSAGMTQRLFNMPRFEIDGRVEIHGSENSINKDAPYFFPDQDFSLESGLHFNHIYYRYYDNTLRQELDLGYGIYQQDGYDSEMIGHVHYEHSYEASSLIAINASIEFGWNVYDGERELNRTASLLVNWKF